jgi:NO-binding membrane sensor protein with MHYT domain
LLSATWAIVLCVLALVAFFGALLLLTRSDDQGFHLGHNWWCASNCLAISRMRYSGMHAMMLLPAV